jgi:mono/diheme cytochrome c family protein
MMKNRDRDLLALLFLLVGLIATPIAQTEASESLQPKAGFDLPAVEHGGYLVKIAGCNDCHTTGYMFSDGQVPVSLWLTGDTFGWRGPWGTTYAPNLRLLLNRLTEEQWVTLAETLRSRPPMPWFNLNAVTKEDLGAMYQFVRYLGPAGELAPPYLPPGQEPPGPHAIFPAPQ